MGSQSIPTAIKQAVAQIIEQFNNEQLAQTGCAYHARFRGRYLYLDRDEGRGPSPIARLEYQGAIDDWEFAIYKYSSERYDPDEWFPGDELLDGTVQGAMRAGLEAYPA